MKFTLLKVVVSSLLIGSAAVGANSAEKIADRDARIIVELKDDVFAHSKDFIKNKQNSFLNEIRENITTNFSVEKRFGTAISGFVLEVEAKDVSAIRNMPSVKKLNYDTVLYAQSTEDGAVYSTGTGYSEETATPSSSTMNKPEGTKEGAGTLIAILDTSFAFKYDAEGGKFQHNIFTELEAEDAVISQAEMKSRIDACDTFHGKYGSGEQESTYWNNKVPFYFDYAGDGSGSSVHDYVVWANGQDHGTHVTSIAAGNAVGEYLGVAPRAQLACMKVFQTYQSGSSYVSSAPQSAIIEALEDCVALGVDAVNMSLGSNVVDFDEPAIFEDVVEALYNKGCKVNIAAGNSGKDQYNGTYYEYWSADTVEGGILGHYAIDDKAMIVASCQADRQYFENALMVNGHNVLFRDMVVDYTTTSGKVTHNPNRHLADIVSDYSTSNFKFVRVPGVGAETDFEGLNCTGKIAVIDRGDINFSVKVQNAVANGAIAVAIIDNTTETEFNFMMDFGDYEPPVPVILILSGDRKVFDEAETDDCEILLKRELPNSLSTLISDYSSDGITPDFRIKPDITTPGENIKGAVPSDDVDSYESMSGTSMATPNMTGAAALAISEGIERDQIEARFTSTATPSKDKGTDNHSSVRRQGAGLINIEAALNTDVYLVQEFKDRTLGDRAKIELGNNDDIKNGVLKLNFAAINRGLEPNIDYTATTYVYRPEYVQVDASTSEQVKEYFGDQWLQTTKEHLIGTTSQTVSIHQGENSVVLDNYDLPEEELNIINEISPTGCIIEGYVILTAPGKVTLSIPFLGYYGDLNEVSPVEPFTFEKQGNDKTNSDFLNRTISGSISSLKNIDFNSVWMVGYYPTSDKVSISSVIQNTANYSQISDSNGTKLKSIGINPYTGEYDPNNLYVGNNGFANTMILSQAVTRSVRDNTITLTNKATKQVVLTDHMYDSLFGSSSDGENTTYPLYRSVLDDSYISNGYIAHRAYTIIPLYDQKPANPYPDGEYEFKIEYELAYGNTYTLVYNITIASEIPTISKREVVEEGGTKTVRLHYSDPLLSAVTVDGVKYQPTKEENGSYIDLPYSEKSTFVSSQNLAYGQSSYLTHLSDTENQFSIKHTLIKSNAYDFSYTCDFSHVGQEATKVFNYQVLKDGQAAKNFTGKVTICLHLSDTLDAKSVVVTEINATGKEKVLKDAVVDAYGYVTFETGCKNFKVTYTSQDKYEEEKPTPEPEPSTKKSGCSGSVAITATMSAMGLLALVLLVDKKRKLK